MCSPVSQSSACTILIVRKVCSISISPAKSSSAGTSTGCREKQSTTLCSMPCLHMAFRRYGVNFSFKRTMRGVESWSNVFELMMEISGRWSTINSTSAPAMKRWAFFAAHTTANSSISVAEYLASVSRMFLEAHCSNLQSPVLLCCQRAMPKPFDWAASVSRRRGDEPSKFASIRGSDNVFMVLSKACCWGSSQTNVEFEHVNGRKGSKSSVSFAVKGSNCWASPQNDRTSVLLTGTGKSARALTNRSLMVYPNSPTLLLLLLLLLLLWYILRGLSSSKGLIGGLSSIVQDKKDNRKERKTKRKKKIKKKEKKKKKLEWRPKEEKSKQTRRR